MAIYNRFSPSIYEEVLVFKVTESEEELFREIDNEFISAKALEIKAPQKRLEFLARNLIFKIKFHDVGLLSKNSFGAPIITDEASHISFSHSFPFVVMYVNKNKPCGIDVEKIREKIIKISPKFVNDIEREFCESNPQLITLIWSAKEVAFKIYQKGGVDFKNHIHLKYENQNLSGKFLKEYDTEISFNYMYFEGHVLVYGVFE